MPKKLKIVFAASEVHPFSKTGGLADVTGALPKALGELGHDVKIITPFYRSTKKMNIDIRKFSKKIFVQLGDRVVEGDIATAKISENLEVLFIIKDEYYDRDEIYRTVQGDYKDNAERFIFFSKAILATLEELDLKVDILHLHDWQTGLVSALLKTIESSNPFFTKSRTIFTVHNLAFQGLFWHYDMHMTNLPWEVFTPEGIEFYGKMNLLKAGLVYSDCLTTVSRKYSEEIQTPEYGFGLEGVLLRRSKDLYGILNGVDYDEWSPEKDPEISSHYSLNRLAGKIECKKELLRLLNFNLPITTPLIGMISRLTDQKGFDILSEITDNLFSENVGLVLLGTGEEKCQKLFQEIAEKFPNKLKVKFDFDYPLSHQIEAGSDFFLMPSRFEPCGLNQIYSLKYGTIPIVRATGGLDDTIEDFNPQTLEGNGFKFKDYSPQTLLEKLKKALEIYRNPSLFQQIIKNAMKCDFSWNVSARQYEEVYYKTLKK
ncbi:MAG: glycogen synthase GlgA [Chlamydiae bacterium]|nr:glycogen synthase GlgA [Chlamydiota bacterium]MBI3276720.1 glycogen synthase GlgA [Chlamydiota bacterium]